MSIVKVLILFEVLWMSIGLFLIFILIFLSFLIVKLVV